MANIGSEARNHVLTTLLATSNEAVDEENERYGHVLIQFLLPPSFANSFLRFLYPLAEASRRRRILMAHSSTLYA